MTVSVGFQDVLPDTAPEHPESFDDILADVSKHIVPGVTHWQHPNFFSFFPANTSPPALLGACALRLLHTDAWRHCLGVGKQAT